MQQDLQTMQRACAEVLTAAAAAYTSMPAGCRSADAIRIFIDMTRNISELSDFYHSAELNSGELAACHARRPMLVQRFLEALCGQADGSRLMLWMEQVLRLEDPHVVLALACECKP